MNQLRLLLRIAMGAACRQWRGTLALASGMVLLAASVAAIPAFDGVLRDLALREALQSVDLTDLQVRVTREEVPLDRTSYSNAQAESDAAVSAALAGTGGTQARMGTTEPLGLHAIGVGDSLLSSSLLGTAAIRFRSGIEEHVELVDGVHPRAQPRADDDRIPVLIGADTADALGVGAGTLLVLHPIRGQSGTPTVVQVAGVARPLDASDPYWSGVPALLGLAEGSTFALLVPEATFFGAAADLLGAVDVTFESSYAIRADEVRASDTAPLVERVRALVTDPAVLPGAHVQSNLPRALSRAGSVTGLDRTALTLLFAQVAAAGGVFVVWLSAHLASARRDRHAALAVRGASTSQRTAVEAFTILPAGLAALVAGPPLAAAPVAGLGRLDAIGATAGGDWLRFELTAEVALYGAAGAALAFVLALAPAALVARRGADAVSARGVGRPGLVGAGAAALLAAVGGGFWLLTRGDDLFGLGPKGVATEYPVLLAPVALLLPATVGGCWLLPQLARPLARAVAISPSVVWLEAFRSLARRPVGTAFALVVIAAGAAVLLATLPGALDRSPGERAAHAAGADVRALGLRGLDAEGESAFRTAIAGVPATAASPVTRVEATLTTLDGSGDPVAIEVLGVEPASFGGVATVRDDFSRQPLDGALAALSTNATSLDGIAAPPGTRQLGGWVRLHNIDGEIRIALSVTDAAGRSYELLLGRLQTGALVHWGFLAADLQTPIGLDGAPIGRAIEAPLTIHAVYAQLSPDVARNAGGISFGPIVSTLDAPEAPLDAVDRLVPQSSEFARRAILHDLEDTTGLEPIADLSAVGTSQTVRANPPTAPGATGSTRLDWPSDAEAVRVRGFRQETDGAPVLLYASRQALDDLGATVGDELRLEVAGRFLAAQAAGLLEHFPTLGADGSPFAVANLDRLLAAVNASPGANLRSTEAWFATSTPAATGAALAGAYVDATTIVDRDAELATLAGARTLAGGWRGVLTLGFGALIALAFLAVAIEGVATLRGAERDSARAEALGGSGGEPLAAAVLTVLARLAAAAALGAGTGVLVARWLLDTLGADPAGAAIVPPPRIEIAPEPLLIAAGALAASFVLVVAAAALRYRGWSPHQALQLREA